MIIVRRSNFDSNSQTLQPEGPEGPKRRGRPKVGWAKGVFKHAVAGAGSIANVNTRLGRASKHAWENAALKYCHNDGLDSPF